MADDKDRGEGLAKHPARNSREERLKQALRENLKRRKSQAKERKTERKTEREIERETTIAPSNAGEGSLHQQTEKKSRG